MALEGLSCNRKRCFISNRWPSKNGSFKVICTHHEQSAGYAAVAEAQLTESPSLCLVSTGCASTNCVTPVLNAWQDNIPVIFISGQNILNETTYYKK